MRTLILTAFLVACGGDTPPAPEPAPVAAKPEPKKEEPKPEPKKKVDFATLDDAGKHSFLMEKGEQVYLKSTLACSTCHGAEGKGTSGVFPPLVGQKDHMGDCVKHAAIVVYGLTGEMEVDGVKYNGAMVAQGAMLNDLEIASVITFERNSWGNGYGDCSPEDVKKARAKNPL